MLNVDFAFTSVEEFAGKRQVKLGVARTRDCDRTETSSRDQLKIAQLRKCYAHCGKLGICNLSLYALRRSKCPDAVACCLQKHDRPENIQQRIE